MLTSSLRSGASKKTSSSSSSSFSFASSSPTSVSVSSSTVMSSSASVVLKGVVLFRRITGAASASGTGADKVAVDAAGSSKCGTAMSTIFIKFRYFRSEKLIDKAGRCPDTLTRAKLGVFGMMDVSASQDILMRSTRWQGLVPGSSKAFMHWSRSSPRTIYGRSARE